MDDALLIEFASEFRAGILDGRPSDLMCAMVCWPLATLLNLNGVDCVSDESVVDLGDATCTHVFIRLADGRVLDPTADQFGDFPSVYLGPPNHLHQQKDCT